MDAPGGLDRAETLISLGRPAEAETMIRAHLGQEPDSAHALWLLAQCLNRQDRYADAATAGRRALALEPEDTGVRITLTNSLLELDQVDEARELALGTVHLDPQEWVSSYVYAQALMAGRRPRTRDALGVANHVVRLAPNSADAHNLAGLCLDELGDRDAARRAYEKALELDPQHAQAMNNLATLDFGMFRMRRASRGLVSALQTEPGEKVLQQNLKILVARLSWRLYLAILGAGLVIGILLGTDGPWSVRAVVGLVAISLCGWLAESSRQHLPRGIGGTWRGLFGNLDLGGRCYLALAGFALICVTFMAFAPRDVAVGFAIALLTVARLVGLLLIIGCVLGAIRSLFRPG